MLKTLKRPVQVVWVFRRTQWIALFTTDLNLSITQIIEYYGARWKIESGFKELKQDIGSQKSQCRNAQAVTNHLNHITQPNIRLQSYRGMSFQKSKFRTKSSALNHKAINNPMKQGIIIKAFINIS
ncbi:transposase [Bathymodiolus platifrons methanotrophic gill symbiont]|uniref:transposase n=1 Tax=Bathymodiolus platifrons methanotrophic gill symbiont TaxID=113268 RepID=UPI001E45AB08|nr:transposase [Bathymodiolus platifrons methanotrophic gill symbiont]